MLEGTHKDHCVQLLAPQRTTQTSPVLEFFWWWGQQCFSAYYTQNLCTQFRSDWNISLFLRVFQNSSKLEWCHLVQDWCNYVSWKIEDQEMILLFKFLSWDICFSLGSRCAGFASSKQAYSKWGGFCKIQLLVKLLGTEHRSVFYTMDFCQHSCAAQEQEEVWTLTCVAVLTETISKYAVILAKLFSFTDLLRSAFP